MELSSPPKKPVILTETLDAIQAAAHVSIPILSIIMENASSAETAIKNPSRGATMGTPMHMTDAPRLALLSQRQDAVQIQTDFQHVLLRNVATEDLTRENNVMLEYLQHKSQIQKFESVAKLACLPLLREI